MKTFAFALMGCGQRGGVFADWLLAHPEAGRVVAVAEPDDEKRNRIADAHGVPEAMRFRSWEDLLARPKLADVAINALMDRLHRDSAVRALDLGYHLLLEKPMAVTLEDCVAIDEARRRNGRIASVCHSLRYHRMYAQVKALIDEGRIGQVVSLDQLEGVDPQHQSHSFVRGNWSREETSTFMLMAKSCHDVDVLQYLMGSARCRRVSSFGGLSHFRRENAPPGAPARCLDGCPVDTACPYSARKLYVDRSIYAWCIGIREWPSERIEQFLRETDYGRCAYRCDNDVVDHQVVALEFEGGATATFTMTAFAPGGRRLRVHGTHGFLQADLEARTLELHEFWQGMKKTLIELPADAGTHGGADDNVMHNLVAALRAGDPEAVLTTTAESLRSHAIVFAAEAARRSGQVVDCNPADRPH